MEADSSFAEHRLADLHLPDEGVLVLGIRQEDGTFLGAPRGDTAIHEQDTLVVYGYADVLEGLESCFWKCLHGSAHGLESFDKKVFDLFLFSVIYDFGETTVEATDQSFVYGDQAPVREDFQKAEKLLEKLKSGVRRGV